MDTIQNSATAIIANNIVDSVVNNPSGLSGVIIPDNPITIFCNAIITIIAIWKLFKK